MNRAVAVQIASDNRMFGTKPESWLVRVSQFPAYAEVHVWDADPFLRYGYTIRVSRFEMDAFDRECFDAVYNPA